MKTLSSFAFDAEVTRTTEAFYKVYVLCLLLSGAQLVDVSEDFSICQKLSAHAAKTTSDCGDGGRMTNAETMHLWQIHVSSQL